MNLREHIEQKLQEHFSPTELIVLDESHLHAGHSSAPAGGESHFRVMIVADAFENISKPMRHRSVYKVLETEMKERIHALALQTDSPQEYRQKQEA